jgi:hypothetical protein
MSGKELFAASQLELTNDSAMKIAYLLHIFDYIYRSASHHNPDSGDYLVVMNMSHQI